MPEQRESAILEGCRGGNQEAQRQLYERYVGRTYRCALRLTCDSQDAFDVTQETFVRAFTQIRSFAGRSSIGTWLYRITTNEALQLARRRKLEKDQISNFVRANCAPEENLSSRCDMEDALSKISLQNRTILVLKYVEGLSYEEIAHVLEYPMGTVASRLNRAREELRDVLTKES